MERRLTACLVLVVFTTAAGCSSLPTPSEATAPEPSAEALEPVVVVGIVDDGINPYHEQFQDPSAHLPDFFLDNATGLPPTSLKLASNGTFDERVSQDRSTWEAIEKGRLYWFQGTRILAMTLLEPSSELPVLSTSHGNAVSSALRNVSTDTWVVMVQLPGLPAPPGEGPLATFEKTAAGIQWLSAQPWVDVISLSRGLPGNPPGPTWSAFVRATQLAVQQGKVVIVGAGNEPTPSIFEGTSGPPWVINVGGVEISTHGEQAQASKLVDVVADYTWVVAAREPDQYQYLHGTSLATPAVAANVAQALLELRRAHDELGPEPGVLCRCGGRNVTQADVRAALNASAVYWDASQYDPLNYSAELLIDYVLFPTVPILPTPWLQMGWGYVGNETWRTIVAALEGAPPPPHSAEAVQYMAAQQAAREAYWSLPR